MFNVCDDTLQGTICDGKCDGVTYIMRTKNTKYREQLLKILFILVHKYLSDFSTNICSRTAETHIN